MSTDPMTLPHRIEAAEGADAADLLYEAWNTLAQANSDFRRFACTVINPRTGKTNAGRFADLLEAGAFVDAALTLVPEGWRFYSADASVVGRCRIMLEGPKTKWAVDSDGYDCAGDDWYSQGCATTPALALCAAALRAEESSDGE